MALRPRRRGGGTRAGRALAGQPASRPTDKWRGAGADGLLCLPLAQGFSQALELCTRPDAEPGPCCSSTAAGAEPRNGCSWGGQMLTGPQHACVCMQLLACVQSGRGGRKGRSPAASEGLRSGAKLGLCLVWPPRQRWDRQHRARVHHPSPKRALVHAHGRPCTLRTRGRAPCQAAGVTQPVSPHA